MRYSAPSLERKRPSVSSVDSTRERLLDAAADTFAKDGIRGATTREIARKARVNEVTLFRHFKSKEQLLRAVLQRGLASEVAIMDQHSSWKENLRESMEKYARHYYSHLEKKKGMARAFLADDLEFVGLFETYRSADEYLKALTGLLQVTVRLEVKGIIGQGNDAAVFFDLETKAPAEGKVLVAEWHRFKNGKISHVRSAFDGRPYAAMFAGAGRK